MQTLSTSELSKMRRENAKGFLLINVLDPPQFQKQRIPGSINIPVSDENFVQQVRDRAQNRDEKIVVYCASRDCDASPRAAKKLETAGFSNIYDYETGMAGWKSADKPVAPSR